MAGKRRPEPAQLRLLKGRGNGKDQAGKAVVPPPSFRRGAPNPPSSLSREARAEWRRIVPGLAHLDLLKVEDRTALTIYCELVADVTELRRQLRESGRTITTPTGVVKPHPLVGDLRATIRELRAWVVQLGLSPAAEVVLSARAAPGNDGTETWAEQLAHSPMAQYLSNDQDDEGPQTGDPFEVDEDDEPEVTT